MKRFLLFAFLFLVSISAWSQATSYICAGESKTLSVTNPTGCTGTFTYLWTRPDATTVATQTVSVTVAGVYTALVTCSTGCTLTYTHTVNIEDDPTSGITINAVDGCVGSSQTISATGVPSGYTYSWNFGSGATPATSTTASTSVSYSTTGTKTITLTISKTFTGTGGGCGSTCTWTKTKTINISQLTGGGTTCN